MGVRELDAQIARLRDAGLTQVEIAGRVGIGQTSVSRALARMGCPVLTRGPRPSTDPRDRFMAKVAFAPSGCWEWVGSRHWKGYGQFHMNEKHRTHRAHRVSYELFVGPIPEGLEIDHLCHNRGCVNPIHLQPVTGSVNQLRGLTLSKRYAARTHCNQGHPLDGWRKKLLKSGQVKYYRSCSECHRVAARKRGHPERRKSA